MCADIEAKASSTASATTTAADKLLRRFSEKIAPLVLSDGRAFFEGERFAMKSRAAGYSYRKRAKLELGWRTGDSVRPKALRF